jgi:hypothetical protein
MYFYVTGWDLPIEFGFFTDDEGFLVGENILTIFLALLSNAVNTISIV